MFFDTLFDDFNPFGRYSYRQPRPQTSSLYRNDNNTMILRKLLNDEYNYMCFDCHREMNDLNYFDLKNGIFLCYNCAQQHASLSKEITQPMTGNIRSLEEKDLLILYHGGNKNLLDFIRRHYPLLENMKPKDMYATKAMDYYRKLLKSKVNKERGPEMPGKKQAYSSIFQKNESPTKEQRNKNIREKRRIDNDDEQSDSDEDRGNLFKSFFGDDLFNRNRQNKRETKKNNEDNKYLKTEPADINKKENEENENDDAGMKKEKRKNSDNKNEENEQKNKKYEPKYKKVENRGNKEKNEKKEKNENIENNIKVNTKNTLTINQIGDLNRYPDAMEIDGMDCE